MRHCLSALLAALALLPVAGRVAAEESPKERQERFDRTIRNAWTAVLDEARQRNSGSLVVSGLTAEEKEKQYEALVTALFSKREIQDLFALDDATRATYLTQTRALAKDMAASPAALAQSANAAATNPRKVGLVERSGIVHAVTTALESSGLISADDTAVTINLNAAALLKPGQGDTSRAAALRYRDRGWLNRVGGSVTFGASLPAKDIVGISGFPNADKLFKAVSWDAKIGLVGDRDPRAKAWDGLLLGRLGGLNWARTDALGASGIPFEDKIEGGALNTAFETLIDRAVADVKRTIQWSLEVSVKFSGKHLTDSPGMNTYAGTLLFDKGLGSADLTLNATYSAVQDVSMGPGKLVTLKQWKVAGGLTGSTLRDAVVEGQSAEVALSAQVVLPQRPANTSLDRRTTWSVDLSFKLPVTASAQLPVSITYTNDPNELTKRSFVRGQFGINYDFGFLKNLAAGK